MTTYKKYDHYKNSGVEWRRLKLAHIFRPIKERVELGDMCLLTPSVVFGVIPQSALPHRPQQALREDYKVAPAKINDFVISMSSHAHGIEWCGYEGGISPDYTLLRLNLPKDYAGYLKWALKSSHMITQLGQFKSGVRMGLRLQWSNVKHCKAFIPDAHFASAIATYLDRETAKIDALIEKKEKLIKLLEEKRQALISHAVTKGLNPNAPMKDSGVEWLGEVPAHWEVKRLRYVCNITTGDKDTVMTEDDGKYPFFVRSPIIRRINTYSYDGEGVLTSGDGAGVGKIYHHYIGRFDFHQRVYLFYKFRDIQGRFFFHFLASNFHKVALDGGAKSTVDSLRLPLIQNFALTFPSLEEQTQITDFIDSSVQRFDALIKKTEKSITLLREKRSALITAAVTGQIDVRDEVA